MARFPQATWTRIAFQELGPFGQKKPPIEFPKESDWINTRSPLQLSDLKGKLVLLDFWTYCCINCMHVLPVLKEMEQEFDKQLVVIGVHSAKFQTERDTDNIRAAMLRYEIRHPVINDADRTLWKSYDIQSWPTLVLLDPEGNMIWNHAGEIPYSELKQVVQLAVRHYAARGQIDHKAVRFELAELSEKDTPLRFPGKVLADELGRRLFIADSNHHRIVVTDLDGKLQTVIGSGRAGKDDGTFADATMNHPQGMALAGPNRLYVADTDNHLIRRVDLTENRVTTVAGNGTQLKSAWPSVSRSAPLPQRIARRPLGSSLASPWDLWVDRDRLFIAMAGTHQIWRMTLDERGIGQYAGNGIEDIVDGPLLPRVPYGTGSSSFAQPSGLTSDGQFLYVADSEGSSIRRVPMGDNGAVSTIIGTSSLPNNRLFTFGDRDGSSAQALLQHPLAVAYHEGKLFIADTYNNKIKSLNLDGGGTSTLIGKDMSDPSDEQMLLDEPAGISVAGNRLYIADTNHHAIRVWDISNAKLSTLAIDGLTPPSRQRVPSLPTDATVLRQPISQLPKDQEKLRINIALQLAAGWKINELAPLGCVAEWRSNGERIGNPTSHVVEEPKDQFSIEVNVPKASEAVLHLGVTYYYCRSNGLGLCLADSIIFEIPVQRTDASSAPASIQVMHKVQTGK